LLGDRSIVVDPRGQSHPLRSQAVAQGSFLKLILPPMPAEVRRSGPTFGIGIGVGYSHFHGRHGNHAFHHGGLWHDPFWYDEPRYYSVYDPNDSTYWEWSGEGGEARLVLVFDQGGKLFTHEFVFKRKRV
jgi:hypothetical protein